MVHFRLVRTVLSLGLCFAVNQQVQALTQVTLPLDPQESVVTCFSGLTTSGGTTVDPTGYVLAVVDSRIPEIPGNPTPVNDTNWLPSMYHNELGSPSHRWDANKMGQVFGLCLDDAAAPNIFVASTSVYGNFPVGPAGWGAIYRINGTTGNVCTFATLPNGGPGLGNLAFDPVSNHIFASNHEDGLIYSIPLGNGCGAGNWTTYDHGQFGRPAEGLPAILDPGSNNTFTPFGRRVWGLCVEGDRLYYGVWWEDKGRPNATEQNEIWSVQIDAGGNCIAATATREAILPTFGSYTGTNPISDIEFTESGAMLAAERTMEGDKGALELGISIAHRSRVLKFTGSSGSWTMLPDNTYNVGSFYLGTNAAGGVSSDCEEFVWATGDALHYYGSTGHSDLIYGLQRIAPGGNTADSPYTLNSFLIGLGNPLINAGYAKTQIGEVDYIRSCKIIGEGQQEGQQEGQAEGSQEGIAEGHVEGIEEGLVEGVLEGAAEGQEEGEDPCMTLANGEAECATGADGATINYSVDVTNLSGVLASWVLITPQTAGVTITPNVIATSLPDGATGNVAFSISGAQPGEEVCFTITLQDERHRECCSETICIENPCNCLVVAEEKIECKEDGTYTYSFVVTNVASFTMEHMYLFVDAPVGAMFTPNYIDLPTLLPGQTSGMLTVNISGGQPGEQLCYTLSVHDRRLDECCYFSRCITLPDCCENDTTPPIIDCPDNATVDCGADYTFIPGVGDNCDPTFAGQVKVDGKIDTSQPGLQCVTVTVYDDAGNVSTRECCVTVLDNCNDGGVPLKTSHHTADIDGDEEVSISEMLRVVQLFNVGSLHKDDSTEDGYAPGPGSQEGEPHNSDYVDQDWSIDLAELLRLVQFYNTGAYANCALGEDGFCPVQK